MEKFTMLPFGFVSAPKIFNAVASPVIENHLSIADLLGPPHSAVRSIISNPRPSKSYSTDFSLDM